jgi:hypothetical protein
VTARLTGCGCHEIFEFETLVAGNRSVPFSRLAAWVIGHSARHKLEGGRDRLPVNPNRSAALSITSFNLMKKLT